MKKAGLILLSLLALGVIGFLVGTWHCKSKARDASSRVGFSVLDGCFFELSGDRVPLK